MAKLIYTYAVMNSGKSNALLQANYNYISEGHNTILISHKIDNRFGVGVIASRIGLQAPCHSIDESTNIFNLIKKEVEQKGEVACIFADEIQFYTEDQIEQLSDVVDVLNIPVMAYGLKTNFQGSLFDGSSKILAYADEIRMLKQVCHCKKQSNMILRYGPDGSIQKDGDPIAVGAESMYKSVCRKHWKEGNLGQAVYDKLGIKNPFKSSEENV